MAAAAAAIAVPAMPIKWMERISENIWLSLWRDQCSGASQNYLLAFFIPAVLRHRLRCERAAGLSENLRWTLARGGDSVRHYVGDGVCPLRPATDYQGLGLDHSGRVAGTVARSACQTGRGFAAVAHFLSPDFRRAAGSGVHGARLDQPSVHLGWRRIGRAQSGHLQQAATSEAGGNSGGR